MSLNNFKEIAKQTHDKFSLLNATNVFPGLWIGSMYAASDKEFLSNNNIKYILTVTEDSQENPEENNSIVHLYIPMRDEVNFNAMKLFPKACQFIDNALKPRFQQAKNEIINSESTIKSIEKESFDNVLVHCQLGISRSATIISAYFLYKYYECNTQNSDNVDSRKILQHLIENDLIFNGNNNGDKLTENHTPVVVPFEQVSSVLKYLQRKRPTIKPNSGFERQLQLWQSKLANNYEKEFEKNLKKTNGNMDFVSASPTASPSSPSRRKEENRLSNSLEYLKIYSISKCNDIKYKYLSKKKSTIKNNSDRNPSKISKEEVAKKLNL